MLLRSLMMVYMTNVQQMWIWPTNLLYKVKMNQKKAAMSSKREKADKDAIVRITREDTKILHVERGVERTRDDTQTLRESEK